MSWLCPIIEFKKALPPSFLTQTERQVPACPHMSTVIKCVTPAKTDSRCLPHCEISIAVWQRRDGAHGGLNYSSEWDETRRVIGDPHAIPFSCKLNTHKTNKNRTQFIGTSEQSCTGYMWPVCHSPRRTGWHKPNAFNHLVKWLNAGLFI